MDPLEAGARLHLREHVVRHRKSLPDRCEASIGNDLKESLDDLLLGRAIVDCHTDVEFKSEGAPLRGEHRDGHKALRSQVEP